MLIANNIKLRAIEEGDESLYHRWINTSETNAQRGLYQPHSLAESKKWLQAQALPSDDKMTLVIEGSGGAVGLIGIKGICRRSQRAEIWIYIGETESWGKGLGTAAIKTLCDYAFYQMNLHRIWLECDPENIGAVRCYEKNGFRKEGVHRDGYYRNGRYWDTVTMGLLRTDGKVK